MTQVLSTWFANPAMLGLLTVLPSLALLMARAQQRRLQALALLGQPAALQKLQPNVAGVKRRRTACLFLGLALVCVGAAGPRWGGELAAQRGGAEGALVLVLDVSRSMLAEQPSRQELARRALRDLAATLSEHGGPRVALVVFAAHPQLAFPLTSDYDHLVDALGRIDADDLPPKLRPQSDDGSPSGTRMGAALRLAMRALDPDTGGDILLLSDGDDPAGDEEWLEGAEEARRRQVRVHTVGLGNPTQASTIPFGSGNLEFAGKPVKTRLDEKPLQEIARRTGGTYVPAHTSKLPLGKLLPSILASQATTLPPGPEKPSPLLRPRYAWFLAPALALLALTLVMGERGLRLRRRPALARVLLVTVAAALVGAAPLTDVDALLRQGTQAFAGGRYQEALELFEAAEEFAPDPGLVAFNKAAALYRLERYAEAALHYERCLEDDSIPPTRRAQAYFQMGHAYVHESKGTNRGLLEKALAAYRSCLLMHETPEAMRADARHDLELARLLWLQTLPDPETPPRQKDQVPPKNGERKRPPGSKDPKDGARDVEGNEPDKKELVDGANGDTKTQAKKARAGPLTVLPDRSELVPLSPQETAAHLEANTQRMLQERRHYRRHAVTVADGVKDW